MDDDQAWFSLVNELERQLTFADFGADDLRRALANNDNHRVWASIQSFIFATGIASALLWPPKPQAKKQQAAWARRELRASQLRERLSLSDSSPLNSRTLRHHFAHLDERIGDWADEREPRGYVEPDAFRMADHTLTESDWPDMPLRIFDETRWLLTFSGKTFELEALAEETTRLVRHVRPLAFSPFQESDLNLVDRRRQSERG